MKQHNQSYTLYYSLVFGGVICFAITSTIGYLSAVSQSASGGIVLGLVFIAIHVIGVAVMGSVTGSFARRGRWLGAIGTCVLVIGASILSAKNTMDYYATEYASVMKARQAQATAQEERAKAILAATQKRQDLQADLAKSTMKWIQGTKGKNQADMAEQGRELIKDVGKADVSMPDLPKTEVIVRSGYGNELLAKFFGWDKDNIELGQMLYASIFIIILESILWPVAAYFKPVAEAAPLAIGAATPLLPIVEAKTKLLAAPRPRDKPPTIKVEPDTGWRALLDEADYPSAGSIVQGAHRPKDKREHVAPRFLLWLHAHGLAGDITTDNLTVLYDRFNSIDHRTPWGERIVKSELEGLGKKFATKNTRNSPAVYSIPIQTPEKVRALLEKKGVLEPKGGNGGAQDLEPEDTPPIEPEGGDSKVFALFGRARSGLH